MILQIGFLAMLLPAAIVMAQDEVTPAPEPDDTAESTPVYTPLSLGENYSYAVSRMFNVPTLLSIAGRAAVDHVTRDPAGWGSTSEAYALQFASRFGRVVVRENVAFGVRALDGEDPRYARSGKGGFWKRTGYATGHTFAVRNRHGGLMPAWSVLISNYTTPFIAQQWRPDGTLGGRELRGGSMGVGLAVTRNLYQEFWPDVLKRFHR